MYSGARTQEPALFQSSSGDSDAHPGLGQPQLQRKVGTPSHRLAWRCNHNVRHMILTKSCGNSRKGEASLGKGHEEGALVWASEKQWSQEPHLWGASLQEPFTYINCIKMHSYGEGNTAHSSTLAWEIPRTEKPGRLQSLGPQRGGHDWAHTHTHKDILYNAENSTNIL